MSGGLSHQERLMQILLAPVASEKSAVVGEKHNQTVFKVLPSATKTEIKQAVELLFKVEVVAVRTVTIKGKRKNFGRVAGRRSDWKKAYVALKPGFDINFATA